MHRREFVAACGLSLLAPLIGACASLAALRVPVEGGRVRVRLSEHPSLAQPGGTLKILPEGAEDPLYVLSLGNDDFTVLSPICTHRGCTVDVQGDRLVCPCHGSTYDRRGQVLRGPAERALQRYDVALAEGILQIAMRPVQ